MDTSWCFEPEPVKEEARAKLELPRVRYGSGMFSLLVGPDEVRLNVLEGHLAASPMLKTACNSNFIEASERVIRMPDDDVTSVVHFVDWLYSGDFDVLLSTMDVDEGDRNASESAGAMTDESEPLEESSEDEDKTDEGTSNPAALRTLASVYVLAEKYQVRDLLVLCLEKMPPFINLTTDPKSFLEMASLIYQGTPSSDQVFRPYFRDYCRPMLVEFGKGTAGGNNTIKQYIAEGGDLAADVFQAYCELNMLQRWMEPDSEDCWFDRAGPDSPEQVAQYFDRSLSLQKMKVKRLLHEHAVYHPRCKCHMDDSEAKFFHEFRMDAYGQPQDVELEASEEPVARKDTADPEQMLKPVGLATSGRLGQEGQQSLWKCLKTRLGGFRGLY